MDLSIIVPAYNAESKLGRCLRSLDRLRTTMESIEVIFVDDASTDSTLEILQRYAEARQGVTVLSLPVNTGSPSGPRNKGLASACGDYVFFLDIDDEILPTGVAAEMRIAREKDLDIVRAPLIRQHGSRRSVMNRITEWPASGTPSERVAAIIGKQSTTVCGLYRRLHLVQRGITWAEDCRMGEDTMFLADAMVDAAIGYVDEPDFVYRTIYVPGAASSTQQYEDRELLDHLTVWRRASQSLENSGVDYFAVRGQVALQTAFDALRRLNRGGIARSTFDEFQAVLRSHGDVVRRFDFNRRIREIRDVALDGTYEEFLEVIKLRIVVAGYDLKFIMGALPALRQNFNIAVDEWTGHDAHDARKSERLLKWADVIHCEWMLGNAVWYSHRKRPEQRLVTRLHLFEITRDYGDKICRENTDRIIAVSLPTLEDMQVRFGFDRDKVRMIPNWVDVDSYRQSQSIDKLFNLAMVGSLPARKGLHRALQLLKELRCFDSRYNLTVFGKRHTELPWVANDPVEGEYYRKCDQYIVENSLEGAVAYAGWTDTKEALADYGWVLSMSDFESFHVAPAEGFAAGNAALFLPWRGVEYIYPSNYVVPSIQAMRDLILGHQTLDDFQEFAEEGARHVQQRYSLEAFVDAYSSLVYEMAS